MIRRRWSRSSTSGRPAFHPVLDEAHIGDIRGALGTLRMDAIPHRDWRSRVMAMLAIMGPGLIVMVGDNDAGGVSTYAQAGQNYGTTLLWTLILLIPVLIVNQEMVIRLGAVTGVGHARLINERFGRFWGWFSVGDLFILNFLTIVTEFIGVSLALSYFGVSKFIAVPAAAVLLDRDHLDRQLPQLGAVHVRVRGRELPRDPAAHARAPGRRHDGHDSLVPSIQGGASSTAVLLIIAIVGTTVAPWQLFFQQSNIIDKRITPRWINYERADTVIGAFVVVIAAGALISIAAFAFAARRWRATTPTPGVAEGLRHFVGPDRRRVLRDPAAQRVADRRRRGDAVDLLRVRRRVRAEPLAAPRHRRGQGVLRELHADGRAPRPRSCSSPARRSGSSRPRSRRWPACCCRARPSSCCCCATTARCSGRGATRAG